MLTETQTVNASEICTDLGSESNTISDFPILVYRPSPWPETTATDDRPRPWVLIQHGQGQVASEYVHLAQPLVERGFVVFSADLVNEPASTPIDEGMSDRIRCSLRWIREEYAPEAEDGQDAADMSPLGECYGLIGHSRGGAGAVLAAQREQEEGTGGPVAAVVAIAPVPPSASVSLPAERSFAYLSLVGTTDEDQTDGGFNAYEVVGDEALQEQGAGPGSEPGRYGDKALVVAYGVKHDDWGGVAEAPGTRGYAVAESYIIPFLEVSVQRAAS